MSFNLHVYQFPTDQPQSTSSIVIEGVPTEENSPMYGYTIFPGENGDGIIINGITWVPDESFYNTPYLTMRANFGDITATKANWGSKFDTTSLTTFFAGLEAYLNTNEATIRASLSLLTDNRVEDLNLLFLISENISDHAFDFWMCYIYEGNYGTEA